MVALGVQRIGHTGKVEAGQQWPKQRDLVGVCGHVALYAQADGETHQYYSIATAQWAKQWPVEDLWAARLTR